MPSPSRQMLREKKKKIASLTGFRSALPRRTSQAIGTTAPPIRRKDIWGAGRRVPSTHLRRVASRVLGCSTDLCRRCELTLRCATRRAAGVTHGSTAEFASVGVATRRVGAFPWIAVLSTFHNAVSTHLEREHLATRVRIRETAGIHSAASCGRHQRTWQRISKGGAREVKIRVRTDVPDRTLGEVHLSAHRNWAHQKPAISIACTGGQRATSTRIVASICTLWTLCVNNRQPGVVRYDTYVVLKKKIGRNACIRQRKHRYQEEM